MRTIAWRIEPTDAIRSLDVTADKGDRAGEVGATAYGAARFARAGTPALPDSRIVRQRA